MIARNAIGPTLGGRTRGKERPLISDRKKHVDLAPREFAIAFLVAVDIRCLDVFERKVLAFLIAQFGHALEEGCIKRGLSGLNTDEADTQHLGLRLRARRERPRGRRE